MFKQELQGMYTIKKYCAITGELKQEIGPFCNKITDIGLNRVGTSGIVANRCYVGTGTAASTFTDSAMGSESAATVTLTDTEARSSVVPYWHQRIRTFRFAAGVINGNITEVGVGWGTTSTNSLWSRELIVDSGGNPITLTVLENEFLDVVYSLRFYPSTADFSSSIVIDGITYNYTGRTANINSAVVAYFSGYAAPRINNTYAGPCTLGAVTSGIQGATSSSSVSSFSDVAYTDGSYTKASTSNFSLTSSNLVGGIKALLLHNTSNSGGLLTQSWQLVFDNPIPKTIENTLGLTIQVSWARYSGTIVP